MKKLLSIAACVATLAAAAFSSREWLAMRNDDSDAARLRAAYADCLKKLDSPAQDVNIPLESFPDGTIKSRISAARAQLFLDTDLVWGEKIHVEQLKPDGTRQATLDADNCIVDRKSRSGWVAGEALMTYGNSSVRGRGVYFSLSNEFIKIFSQSEIRTGSVGLDPRSLLK